MPARDRLRPAAQVVPYSPIWPPTRLPGCVGWIDCQETLTQAGTVTSIRNMVSGVDWTEAVAPPTYEAAGLNGRPCMVGNASTMKILSTEAAAVAPLVGVGRQWTATMVIDQRGTITGTMFGFGSDAGNTVRGGFLAANSNAGGVLSGSMVDDSGAINLTLNDTHQLSAASACCVTTVCYGGQLRHIVNKSFFGGLIPTPTGQMTPNRLGLLCRPRQTPDGFTAGALGAALFFSRALSASELLGIHCALMGRWRIAT